LKSERLLPLKPQTESTSPSLLEIIPQLDQYLMEIESLMDSLYREMKLLARKKPVLSFTEIVIGKDKLDTIRTFILLLFLAQKQKIWVWQEEELSEIYISLKDEDSFTRNVSMD
jgi:chromatin segregation and condensation protein Rec8/ScpA/Scc1 (kleisin family)